MSGNERPFPAAIFIRAAREDDIVKMYRLEQMCFDIEAFSTHQLQYLINTKTAFSYVAEADGDFAGFIIGLTNRNRFGKYGRVYTLDVDDRFRRMGIAMTLMDALMETPAQVGLYELFPRS